MKRQQRFQPGPLPKRRKIRGDERPQLMPALVPIPRNNLPPINRATKAGFNPELKSVDAIGTLDLTNSGLGSTHTMLINGLIPGTDRFNRIGRRINVKKISIRAFLHTSAIAPAVIDDLFRFAVIWDEQPTGSLPTLADLWQDVSVSGAITNSVLAHNNENNTARFRTLRTITVPMNAEAQGMDQDPNVKRSFIKMNIPMNHICQYNAGTAGTLADIQTGAIYFVAHGLNSPVPTVWSVIVTARMKYLD